MCWDHIWSDTINLQLSEEKDVIIWKLERNHLFFSFKSLYNALTSNDNGQCFKIIWKAKIPHKVKIFMWLLANGVILTKDNLLRRKWKGDPECYFCEENETITYLFFSSPNARV